MAEDIKLPGMKKPANKYVVFGGAAVAGYVGYQWWKGRSSSSATGTAATAAGTVSPTATTDPYPWDGTYNDPSDPNSMDTTTGVTYGDEGAYGGGVGGLSGGGGGGNPGGGAAGGPPFSTNSAWAQYAITTVETNDPTLNPTDVQNAIGEYLAGQPLTQGNYQSIVFDAIAVAGDPPVAGTNGYPPNVQSGGGGGGSNATNPVSGLKQSGSEGFTGADVSWNASTGATSYTVTSDKGTASMSGATSARIHSIGPANSQATVSVLANPAAAGAVPAKVVVHVKGK